jgi:hypothetical protein
LSLEEFTETSGLDLKAEHSALSKKADSRCLKPETFLKVALLF